MSDPWTPKPAGEQPPAEGTPPPVVPPGAWGQGLPGAPPPAAPPPPPQTYGQPQHGPTYGQPPYGQPPYGQPGYPQGYAGGAPRTHGRATAVLVLGIASLVLLFLCGTGIVAGIVGLCLAPRAKREINESAGALSGLGMVKAGVIMSWVTIGLFVVFVALAVMGLAVGDWEGTD